MPLYEHVFLARQDISQQQVEALTQEFRSILEGLEWLGFQPDRTRAH